MKGGSVRCRGYQMKPSKFYVPGERDERGRLHYGKGKCPVCGRVVDLAPLAQTIVNHKSRL
jgi:hypothetical protein